MELLTSLFSNIWSIFLVALFFGGSIFVHELGHFLAARRRGVHVERFAIGFGPAIWSRRGKDGVEYRLSWFPLGGYVLLPQLADLGPIEGESTTDITKLPPISYSTKFIVFIAGATFNVLFAFALACVIWLIGLPTPSELTTNQIGSIAPQIKLADGTLAPSPAVEAGFKPGDIVRSIDGHPIKNFEQILTAVFLGKSRAADGQRESLFTIERAGQPLQLTVHPRLVGDEGVRSTGLEPSEDLTAESLLPDSPALLAGVRPGDRILAVDGKNVFQRFAVSDYLGKNASRAVVFTIQRGAEIVTIPIQPRADKDERGRPVARIGLRYRDNIIVVHPTPWSQLSEHFTGIFRTLGALISPDSDIGPSKMSGPIGIARALHQEARFDFRRVIGLTILVNISLAVFNLLPIPVLDGGQILFATIAKLRGRALPVNFIVAAQSVFMVLLFSMVIYVSFFDVRRLVRDVQTDRAEAARSATHAK